MIVRTSAPAKGPDTVASPPSTTISSTVIEIPMSKDSTETGPLIIWKSAPATPHSAAYTANEASLNRPVEMPREAATGSLRRPIIKARPKGLFSRLRCPSMNTAANPATRYQICVESQLMAFDTTPAPPPVSEEKWRVRSMTTLAYINVTTATANGPNFRAGKAVTKPMTPQMPAAMRVAGTGFRPQCTWVSATV